ncbi:hypothetical protein [Leptospira bouyouniensis]|uniref:hypothetical protein n=1 Tax=Leptospira bouyouniensis TaxID=2484911 RepID=UPI00109155DB|nr:hypothetical protein [Leptospira bouyouniensis]TGM74581.1 hypothetical protein EHQ99_18130 [Leptospira bouyouniensis]
MRNSIKIQARLSEHNLISSWEDYRKEFINQNGFNPTHSDVLGSILHKTSDYKYTYDRRLKFLKDKKDKNSFDQKEIEHLEEILKLNVSLESLRSSVSGDE